MVDGMTEHKRLIEQQKLHPRDFDAAGDLYQYGSEVDLDVGISMNFMLPILDGHTVELRDCGFTLTDAFANNKVSGNIDFGCVFSDAADDDDYVVAAAQIARTAAGVGADKGETYSVLCGNGAQAGPLGTNFAWAAGMDTAAKKIFNAHGIAPGRTDKKILVITCSIAASGVGTTGKGVPWVRYRIYKSAMGE